MSERNIQRRLADSIVEALKSQGHILVVKGGAQALVRELEELIRPGLLGIVARLGPRTVVGEVTSTFGDESADEAVEEMVAGVTHALMDSDHVEDVFAEDNVIRRDVFRLLRDALLQRANADELIEEDEPSIRVRLDTLGYVASTVSKLADPGVLEAAFHRAAVEAEARYVSYEPATREATFALHADGPDARLELEEAVAEELADLVDQGEVDLPTIERRLALPRALTPAERIVLRTPIEVAAQKTLLRSGCATEWEFADASSIHVTLTPLSEQDGQTIDRYVAVFEREVGNLLALGDRPAEQRAESKETAARAPAKAAAPASAKPPSARPASARPASARVPAAGKAPSAAPAPVKGPPATPPSGKAPPAKEPSSGRAAATARAKAKAEPATPPPPAPASEREGEEPAPTRRSPAVTAAKTRAPAATRAVAKRPESAPASKARAKKATATTASKAAAKKAAATTAKPAKAASKKR